MLMTQMQLEGSGGHSKPLNTNRPPFRLAIKNKLMALGPLFARPCGPPPNYPMVVTKKDTEDPSDDGRFAGPPQGLVGDKASCDASKD